MSTVDLIAATAKLQDTIGLREEPLAFFYSDLEPRGFRPEEDGWMCVVAALGRARRGETVYFDREHFGCPGGGYYLGFCERRPDLEYFVSTGIPGQTEGEHYKKSPELVRAFLQANPVAPAPARYAVFQPMSALSEDQEPSIVICFGTGDELSGLLGLANYARAEDAVICPFGSGCSTIVTFALREAQHDPPRAVLGMFDPSARPFVATEELSFAAPLALWIEMLQHADESFLKTATWAKVRKRRPR